MMRPVRSYRQDTAAQTAVGVPLLSLAAAVGVGALGTVLVPGPYRAEAAEPAASVPASPETTELTAQDCRLELKALEALMQDEVLAPLNLGLTVRDHVATLWGPVPSAALGQ